MIDCSTRLQCARPLIAMLGLLLCATVSAEPEAQEVNGHEQIREAVEQFLFSFYPDIDELDKTADNRDSDYRVEIDVGRLDPRLRIDACAAPLETGMNHQQDPVGRITVRVECRDGQAPWTRYIQATVRVFEPVLVSTRTIRRGEQLSAGDMTMQQMELSSIRQTVLRNAETVSGMEARRTIAAGTALTADSLVAPQLVERGDTVILSAERGTIRIQNQGTALQSGELGKRITVRNTRTDRVIQAVITGPGQASVEF